MKMRTQHKKSMGCNKTAHRGNCIGISAYVKKKRSHINNLINTRKRRPNKAKIPQENYRPMFLIVTKILNKIPTNGIQK